MRPPWTRKGRRTQCGAKPIEVDLSFNKDVGKETSKLVDLKLDDIAGNGCYMLPFGVFRSIPALGIRQ